MREGLPAARAMLRRGVGMLAAAAAALPVCGCALEQCPPAATVAAAGAYRAADCRDEIECLRLCDAGNAAGCAALGRVREATGLPALGEQDYRRSCELDPAAGCRDLAAFLGRVARPAEAAEILRGACEGGAPEACHDLALELRAAGRASEARALAEGACDAGYGVACQSVGRAAEAEAAFRGGCAAGDPGSCADLGRLLQVQLRFDEAVDAQADACRGGVAECCAQAGALLEFLEDAEGAAAAYRLGCAAGSVESCAALERFGISVVAACSYGGGSGRAPAAVTAPAAAAPARFTNPACNSVLEVVQTCAVRAEPPFDCGSFLEVGAELARPGASLDWRGHTAEICRRACVRRSEGFPPAAVVEATRRELAGDGRCYDPGADLEAGWQCERATYSGGIGLVCTEAQGLP